MTNLQTERRTDLSLHGIAQVLTELNEINFPSKRSSIETRAPKMGCDDMVIAHAIAEAQRANSHCLL